VTGSIPIDAGVFVPPAPRASAVAGEAPQKQRMDDLMEAAKSLEASFLAEMLKQTGLGKAPEGFGGGVGEDQFTSYLNQLRAEQMVEAGGIGLAESIFEDLKKQVMGDG
jgi:flagellar protein FlgJ